MSHRSARMRSIIYRPGGCIQEVLTHYLLGHSLWACVLVVLLSSTPSAGDGCRGPARAGEEEV